MVILTGGYRVARKNIAILVRVVWLRTQVGGFEGFEEDFGKC